MRAPELNALARDRGLRNYSRMRRAELIALHQNSPPPAPRTRPPRPTRLQPPPPPLVRFRPERPRQPLWSGPSPQEMEFCLEQLDENIDYKEEKLKYIIPSLTKLSGSEKASTDFLQSVEANILDKSLNNFLIK